MFCSKCGKQINDGAKFCNYCGAQMENNNEMQYVNQIPIYAQPAKKPLNKTLIICLTAIAVALVLGLSIGIPLSLKSNNTTNGGNSGAVVSNTNIGTGSAGNNGGTQEITYTSQQAMRVNGKNINIELPLMSGNNSGCIAGFYGKTGNEIYEVSVAFDSEPTVGQTYNSGSGVTVTCNTADTSGNVTGQYTLNGCTVSVTAYQSESYIAIEASYSGSDMQFYLSAEANFDSDANSKATEWVNANIGGSGTNNGGNNGANVCGECNGTGYCCICGGSQICTICHGMGRISVTTYGNGSEYVTCSGCNGTGRCKYCTNGKCGSCGGTGHF